VRFPAVSLDDFREPTKAFADLLARDGLVFLDESRRADHIGVQNDGKLAR
jgi:hypothetical protein